MILFTIIIRGIGVRINTSLMKFSLYFVGLPLSTVIFDNSSTNLFASASSHLSRFEAIAETLSEGSSSTLTVKFPSPHHLYFTCPGENVITSRASLSFSTTSSVETSNESSTISFGATSTTSSSCFASTGISLTVRSSII